MGSSLVHGLHTYLKWLLGYQLQKLMYVEQSQLLACTSNKIIWESDRVLLESSYYNIIVPVYIIIIIIITDLAIFVGTIINFNILVLIH